MTDVCKTGYVYAIGIEGSPLIKVGYTMGDPEKRLKTLQVGIPFRLKLLKVYPSENPALIEYHLHRLLSEQRHGGEWFQFDLDLLDDFYRQASTGDISRKSLPITGMTIQESIGERVRFRRMERHFCQKDFANLVGWKPDYLSRFERGHWTQIDPERLMAVAQALGISTDMLLGVVVQGLRYGKS